MSGRYEIRVASHLAACWAEWLEGWTITYTPSGDTVLCGPVTDQAALHGLLARVRDLNLTLISVMRLNSELPMEAKNER